MRKQIQYETEELTLDSIAAETGIVTSNEKILNGEIITQTDEEEIKQRLENYRKKATFILDEQKLMLANQEMDLIHTLVSKLRDPETIANVEIKSAADLKFLTEAINNSMKTLENLMRMDSIDGRGTPKAMFFAIQFEDNNGTLTNPTITF